MPSDGSAAASKRQKTNSGAAAAGSSSSSSARGTIARVKLHNFMSYRDAEIVDPGTQLNCIVGPNGTGKSSIVCAMCVGLGGPLKITGRGDKISACVHGEGQIPDEHGRLIDSGFVETEIVDAHGPGRNMTVRVDFNTQNKESWQMDGASCTKTKVKQAMEALNIQVDNPLQFLPQDKVGEFSNMSPVELLKHTEMAIGPETYAKHMRLIGDDKDLQTVKQRLVTEEKDLGTLQATNQSLEKDVERFKQLQANKQRLDLIRGKLLWVEAGLFEEEAEKAKADVTRVKEELKGVKERLSKAAQAAAPLEQQKAAFATKLKEVNKRMLEADRERTATVQPKEAIEAECEKLLEQLESLEKTKEKKAKKVDEERHKVSENEKKIEEMRRQLEASEALGGGDVEQTRSQLTKDKTEKDAAYRQAYEALREHRAQGPQLDREHDRASKALAEVQELEMRKMKLVVAHAKQSAHLAQWVEHHPEESELKDHVVGPLLMKIDVPDKAHQPLVEECIGPKFGFAFVATTQQVRSALTRKVSDERWQANVYFNPGQKYVPVKRPSSASMRKFGVTSWLDEAIAIPPEHRDVILSTLKDLTQVDCYLLADNSAINQIEALQEHLAKEGMQSVTVVTPQRIYRVVRSKYDGRLNSITSQPRGKLGLYSNSVDEREVEGLRAAKQAADRALAEHAQTDAQLDERAQHANGAKNAAQTALQTFNQGRQGLVQLEARQKNLAGRLAAAQQEMDEFDVSQKTAELSSKLADATAREVALNGTLCKATARVVSLKSDECALRLASKAAEHCLAEAKEAKEALEKEFDDKEAEKKEASGKAREALDALVRKTAQAQKAAPQLEQQKPSGRRSAEGQRLWDSMPGDLEELDTEIANLEEEINSSDDDGGETLRKYEQRLRDIEAQKQKVGDTQGEVEDKQAALDALTDEWKPELRKLIGVVNENFAMYFRRFRCCGEVSLADGRKLNPATGQPEGDDDFSQYRILIRVQWRKNEELHVLGEGGRDSGGERSVATMVYLISLQNINPAPFRVVDEINQAMDSTNERNVFECITHACREGGKQYFLLTPKLLPDLEYGEETVMQIVLNGPYVVGREQFDLRYFV